MNRIAERVRAAYQRIREVDRPEIWITLRSEQEALLEAETLELRLSAGAELPLAGCTAVVKGNIDVLGLPTTAGCPAFAYEPDADATAVARLRAAGAIVLGSTNLDQFATGLVGTRSPYGAVRNAWLPDRISGGSSSGSAVAVALGIADIGLGTDTAGSGRVPAALNGIVGVKPTRGLVPTSGVVPACRSLDCVTVFARDLSTARTAIELLAGVEETDPLGRPDRPGPALSTVPRLAIPTPEHLRDLADGWKEAFDRAVEAFASTGVEIVQLDIAPLLDAAALLYDGAFVAERTAAVGSFVERHCNLIGSDIDETVAGIVLGGHQWTAVDVFRDRERLDRLSSEAHRLLAGCDALLTPTTTWHPTFEQVAADPVGANSRMGRFTNFANLLDMAALAIPAGSVGGGPFGVMLTGPAFSDRLLAEFASRFAGRRVELAVFGAHLSGQSLNHQLVAAGGTRVGDVSTAAAYRLYALDTVPSKPGLVHVGEGGGSIAGELWSLPSAGFGTFVADIPRPMTIATVVLADGRTVTGFGCESSALATAEDITSLGDWRTYLRAELKA
ncbi:MAG: allophanate hydrolase [Leifsonia sp.]